MGEKITQLGDWARGHLSGGIYPTITSLPFPPIPTAAETFTRPFPIPTEWDIFRSAPQQEEPQGLNDIVLTIPAPVPKV